MRETIKKWRMLAAFIMIALMLMPFMNVSAETGGSIEITATATNTSSKENVAGVKLALYKIANADSTEAVEYKMTADFQKSGVSATDIVYAKSLSDIAEKLAKYASNNSLNAQSEATTNGNGYVAFSGLSDGIYLIRQVNTESDFKKLGYTYTTDPYIVAIPSLDSAGNKVRNVTCQPKGILKKIESKETSLTVYKIWKDDNDRNDARPKKITVGLYKNGKLQGKVDLSAGNNWMYAWNKLDANSKWSVKELSKPEGYKTSVSKNDQVWTITNTYSPSTPPLIQTGDYNNLRMWIGLLMVCIAAIVFTTNRKKVRK